MLVVSRRVGEVLLVSHDFVVEVVQLSRSPAVAVLSISGASDEPDMSSAKQSRATATGDGAWQVELGANDMVRFGEITILIVEVRQVSTDTDDLKVRLGLEAPKEMPIHRKEVYDALYREPDDV